LCEVDAVAVTVTVPSERGAVREAAGRGGPGRGRQGWNEGEREIGTLSFSSCGGRRFRSVCCCAAPAPFLLHALLTNPVPPFAPLRQTVEIDFWDIDNVNFTADSMFNTSM